MHCIFRKTRQKWLLIVYTSKQVAQITTTTNISEKLFLIFAQLFELLVFMILVSVKSRTLAWMFQSSSVLLQILESIMGEKSAAHSRNKTGVQC